MADFESVADELYGGDAAGFIAARDTKARDAKAAGDAALAKRIRELRKPTVAAALVNEMARSSSGFLSELLELGEEWRRAEDGLDVRALIRRRRDLVNKALRGLPKTSEAVAREVEETLEAVVADPDAARDAAAGRLSTALRPSAESDASWLSVAKPVAEVEPPKSKPAPAPNDSAAKNSAAKSAAKKEEAARKRRHDKAVREAAKLTEARDRAAAKLEEAVETARELRAEAVKAEKAAEKAERAEESARNALEKANTALEHAEEQLE
jgi:hypothetical protein